MGLEVPEALRGRGVQHGAPDRFNFERGEYWGELNLVLAKQGRFRARKPMLAFTKYVDELTDPIHYLKRGTMVGVPLGNKEYIAKILKESADDPKVGDLYEGMYFKELKHEDGSSITIDEVVQYEMIHATEVRAKAGLLTHQQWVYHQAGEALRQAGGKIGGVSKLDEVALWKSLGITPKRKAIDVEIVKLSDETKGSQFAVYHPEYQIHVDKLTQTSSDLQKEVGKAYPRDMHRKFVAEHLKSLNILSDFESP